jgi:predicted transcriptional regulator
VSALALVLGAAIAVAAVVFVALPFLREPQTADDRLDAPTEAEGQRLELIEERDRALAALKELEFDHRTRKIEDDDYRRLVGPYRRAAAVALRAIERSETGDLTEQDEVQADDRSGDDGRDHGRHAPVDEVAHHIATRGEPDERDQRKRDPE